MNGDFISPANKIIAHMVRFPDDKVQYANLKQYLNSLIDLCYPNGKPLGKNKAIMLRDISVWLACDETLQFMVKNYSEDYFQMLAKLGQRLLENDSVN